MKQDKNQKKLTSVIKRAAFVWGVNTTALLLMAWLLPGVVIHSIWSAIALLILAGLFNALVWPLISRWMLPITIYTLGLATLFLNGFFLYLLAGLVDGIEVSSIWTALVLAFGVSTINIIVSTLLDVDDEGLYYRNVIKKLKKERSGDISDKPGVIFVEIDGLAEPELKKACQLGYMPTLNRWLKKSHHLKQWETDLSSQTGASQAGILHGSNDNMPAFRWVEKDKDNRVMATSGPHDAPLIEKRHSNGRGLLSLNGGSRGNMFSGDAPDVAMTYSKLLNIKEQNNPIYWAYFGIPYNLIRSIILLFPEAFREIKNRRQQEKENVRPRLGKEKRNLTYVLSRAFMATILRDITTFMLIGDIVIGKNDVVYATYAAYDEVAHHSGVGTKDAYSTLSRMDKQLSRLENAASNADRKYHLVILSDHGQSMGATFKQRYDLTLESLVEAGMGKGMKVRSIIGMEEGWSHLNMMLTDITQNQDHKSAKSVRQLLRKNLYGDSVVMGPEADMKDEEKRIKGDKKEAVVLASGNLGLVYLTGWKRRLTYEQMNKDFPDLILALTQHDGVGFIMVKSQKHGAIAIGKEGINYLDKDKVEGKDPLIDFGKNAKKHLLRTHSFRYCPDILVNSFYDSKVNEVAAYEELIGSHGGLGGDQTKPLIMFPKSFKYPKEKVIGAESLHKVMKSWVNRLSK